MYVVVGRLSRLTQLDLTLQRARLELLRRVESSRGRAQRSVEHHMPRYLGPWTPPHNGAHLSDRVTPSGVCLALTAVGGAAGGSLTCRGKNGQGGCSAR